MPEIISRKEAKEKGLKHYFVKPCKHGHTRGRYTSNGECRDCCLLDYHEYKKKHPDRVKATNRASRERNKEKRAVARRKTYWENPERHRQRCKKWMRDHPGYQARKGREWRESNPEALKEQNRRGSMKTTAMRRALRELGISLNMETKSCTSNHQEPAPPQSHGEPNATPLSFWSI